MSASHPSTSMPAASSNLPSGDHCAQLSGTVGKDFSEPSTHATRPSELRSCFELCTAHVLPAPSRPRKNGSGFERKPQATSPVCVETMRSSSATWTETSSHPAQSPHSPEAPPVSRNLVVGISLEEYRRLLAIRPVPGHKHPGWRTTDVRPCFAPPVFGSRKSVPWRYRWPRLARSSSSPANR